MSRRPRIPQVSVILSERSYSRYQYKAGGAHARGLLVLIGLFRSMLVLDIPYPLPLVSHSSRAHFERDLERTRPLRFHLGIIPDGKHQVVIALPGREGRECPIPLPA